VTHPDATLVTSRLDRVESPANGRGVNFLGRKLSLGTHTDEAVIGWLY
jgi:hypothetical protein